MPEITRAQNYTRTLQIGRETDDKTSRPHFMEWVKEIPSEKPKGEKYRTKTSATGKISHYRLYQGWVGHLVELKRDVKNYGSSPEDVLLATIQDESGEVVIELSFFNSYASDFMKRILDRHFDPTKSLSLSPYAIDKANGKGQNVGLAMYSGADTLAANKKAFGEKPAAPHLAEMPDLVEIVQKGKTTYDSTEQTLWLWSQIEKKVLPRLSTLGGAPASEPQYRETTRGNAAQVTVPDGFPNEQYANVVTAENGDETLPF